MKLPAKPVASTSTTKPQSIGDALCGLVATILSSFYASTKNSSCWLISKPTFSSSSDTRSGSMKSVTIKIMYDIAYANTETTTNAI